MIDVETSGAPDKMTVEEMETQMRFVSSVAELCEQVSEDDEEYIR